jgi:putative heme iron utilization protein
MKIRSSLKPYALLMFAVHCSRHLGTRAFAPSTSLQQRHNPTTLFAEKKAPRHDVSGGGNQVDLPPHVQQQLVAYHEHQSAALKLDFATDVRTLVQYNHGFAVMSTFSKEFPEFPGGSIVGFAPDTDGSPLFVLSGMSAHTQDLLANPQCSLTVAAKDFKGAADGRVNLMGRCELIKRPEEKQVSRETYLKKHPGAFWAEFGDFNWFRMKVQHVRFVGGFARAGSISEYEYAMATPDPIGEFGPAIAKHMNEDHVASTIAMVETFVPGLEPDDTNCITDATITSVDSLGMYVMVTRKEGVGFLPKQFKCRLPFPRQAKDRKDIKALIVEMTQASASSSSSAAPAEAAAQE